MEKINSCSLWHFTPVDIGIDFYDPTISTLAMDEELYSLVSPLSNAKIPHAYSNYDINVLKEIKEFNKNFYNLITKNESTFIKSLEYKEDFPRIKDCFACYFINSRTYLYFLCNGMAVFFDNGEPISSEDNDYFSYEVYKERKIIEDDLCVNKESSSLKDFLYYVIDCIWASINKKRRFTATNDFCIHGIPYTLCIELVDIKDFDPKTMSDQLKKNLSALNETTPFSNILKDVDRKEICDGIDGMDVDSFRYIIASDSLIFADSWAGAILAGDISKNMKTVLSWVIQFEITLQAHWCEFNATLEDVIRKDYSYAELQRKINVSRYHKVELENDISSSMEQIRKQIRSSLIISSEINIIYKRMVGILENKHNLKILLNEKKKRNFSIFTDIMLLVIAIFQIYSVIDGFVLNGIKRNDVISISITGILAFLGIFFIIKSKRD